MRVEYFGEDGVVRNGCVFGGLEFIWVFGDVVYKWSCDIVMKFC